MNDTATLSRLRELDRRLLDEECQILVSTSWARSAGSNIRALAALRHDREVVRRSILIIESLKSEDYCK